MSELKILNGFHIDVAHEKQPRATVPEDGNGQPTVETIDVWTIVLTERAPPTGNQYRISFERDSRDEIVRKLTGGIVLAGGELPKLP